MSPTISILSALVLTLMLGSAECGQRTDPVALLRRTLRYWWKIYKTYEEEVALGYCWADYLLGISDRLSGNLSASSLATTLRDCFNTSNVVGVTKSQQNPFPQNVMVDGTTTTTTTLGETRRKKRHSQEKRSRAAATKAVAVSEEFKRDLDERRIRLKIIRKQKSGEMGIMSRAGRVLRSISKKEVKDDKINEGKKIISFPYAERRQQTPATRSKFFDRKEDSTDKIREFSSRWGTSLRAVNSTPSPGDNDKIGFGSTHGKEEEEEEEKDTRRKVLRFPTSDRDSVIESAFGRSFSLEVARVECRRSLDDHRFPFRWFLSPRRENPRVDGSLFDLRTSSSRGMTRDLARRRVLSNKNGSRSAERRLLFRLVSANTDRRTVVRPMNSKENSSCDPVKLINSRTSRREHGKLSRDSLRGKERRFVGAERSLLESRASGRKAVERIALFKTAGGSDTKKQRYPRSKEEEELLAGKDVSPRTIHPFLSSRLERDLRRQMPHENREFSFAIPTIFEQSKQNGTPVREGAAALSSRVERFADDDYENSISRTARNLRPTALKVSRDRNELSIVQQPSLLSSIYSTIAPVFKTLGMFVQVGRQIIDVVESNTALACTREYLWTKLIGWIV